ncbi:DEAD/DEAH box helicase [Isoptericola sp. NPDC056573]|uniref:DEAD/DEAH box helicase n=1 Tax=Isoptericola sp. NPDC056573 TaxID=3345868 RepID=UPI003673AC28
MSAFAPHLRYQTSTVECDGQLTVYRWRFAPANDDLRDVAVEVGRQYVSDAARLATPRALLANKVPTRDTVVAGDFGEMLARALYTRRVGLEAPFSKLQGMKPVAEATVQGPDVMCMGLTPGEQPQPVTVEVKTRTGGGPADVLGAIGKSTNLDPDYLASAWAAAAELMLTHPDAQRHFALAAAQHLGRLIDPSAALPPHAAHGVAVVGEDKLTPAKLKEYWSGAPPVSVLHVVAVPDLVDLRTNLFVLASHLTYADLTGGVAELVSSKSRAGVTALLSPDMARDLAGAGDPSGLSRVVEAALWFLADHDGIGLARAREAAQDEDIAVKGMAELLTGRLAGAGATLSGHPLEAFAAAARAVVNLDSDREAFLQAARREHLDDDLTVAQVHAAQHVAASLVHRLERHPVTLTRQVGATGAAVQHVVRRLRQYGKHALWPSQAAAIQGGLLDRGQGSVVIKMPTSAGKTTLMDLVVADELDKSEGTLVAVVGPTRALVGQLYRDLRRSLPDEVDVRSSQGGHDYDTGTPASTAVLAGEGVVVVTPERLDLDWRRAETGDGAASLESLTLLVVDEATLVNAPGRGAALERLIARALRRDVRVVLLSSQFSDVQALADWVGGHALVSEWQPAWMERLVYLRGPEGVKPTRSLEGYLWSEGGEATQVLTLKPSEKSRTEGCIRERRYETAAMVNRYLEDGLVVVFTSQKNLAPALFETIQQHVPDAGAVPAALEELAASIEPNHPEEAAALRAGLGLHHADVPRAVKTVIERAAQRQGGLLRCIVCTPTLLEGVDFPARTVIAAYPPQTMGVPDIARLRNLAGRAGRGGNFTSGRLIVMTDGYEQAQKWREAFRRELPPTETALTSAMNELLKRDPDRLSGDAKNALDALTIEALAEAAAVDGDLRHALETALEQTVWSSTSVPSAKEAGLGKAVDYVRAVAARVADPWQRQALYRAGFSLDSCLALRDALVTDLDEVIGLLYDHSGEDHSDELMYKLVSVLVSALSELDALRAVDAAGLEGALRMWVAAEAEDAIEAAYPDAWAALTSNHLETLLPWALTGAFEVIAALAGDLDVRERAHRLLRPVRIRDGVPDAELCELVRRGHDRVTVTRIAREIVAEREARDEAANLSFFWVDLPLADAVEERLAAEVAADTVAGAGAETSRQAQVDDVDVAEEVPAAAGHDDHALDDHAL